MGQKYLLWGILGHDWDTLLHMNFADYYMTWQYNALILLKKTHALGRSLVIFKNSVSRSKYGGINSGYRPLVTDGTPV
ncbi:hypothetical protein F6S98_18295 [Escherichia coli]|nr:hypothetical protein [Escherichia coli]